MSLPEPRTDRTVSSIGYAKSVDGIHFENRKPLVVPEESWEQFGCEDPRVTKIDDTYYIFYTALSKLPFSADGIKVAVATTRDFSKIEKKHLVTPFNAKAMALFPERINGKLVAVLTANTDLPPARIGIEEFDIEEDLWNEEKWMVWYEHLETNSIDPRRSVNDHVEVGAPPIKTDHGWLLIYSYIQNYFGGGRRVFGIEALLLDFNDPRKVLGRTKSPFLIPERTYEKYGLIPDIIFPSGALIEGKKLEIYYGAADTTCCSASVYLDGLVESLIPAITSSRIKRCEGNPILTPRGEREWESRAVFNPAAVDIDGTVRILYRAVGNGEVSVIGYAESKDGMHIDLRLEEPVYTPREAFERKGCEDPRIVLIEEELYMNYTAYDGVNEPSIAVTSISKEDFLKKRWNWERPALISHPGVMDKDSCILPEMVGGKYLVFHREGVNICADFIKTLHFENERLDTCIQVIQVRPGMWDSKKVGIGPPPIRIDAGWVLFYHGVGEDNVYRVGVALLDRENPTNVIGRTAMPIIEPQFDYEKEGVVGNVIFPCGAVLRGGIIYVYYGAADKVVGGFHISVEDVLRMFV
jgi:predicted GH43/DUF377 family glycosyl hydrolase